MFAVTRALNAVMIAVASKYQIATTQAIDGYHTTRAMPRDPGYLGVGTNWDAQWYLSIALHGYPAALPTDAHGVVQQNSWAFSPVFPFLSRAVMVLTGADFAVAGTLVALTTSAAAVVVLYTLVADTAGVFTARATTLLLCTYMAAPAFQIAYTEGPALLLIVGALLLLRRQRYLGVAVVLVVLALTRPVVIAFVPVVVAHAIWRLRHEWPDRNAGIRLCVLLVSALGASSLWPLVAALVTGRSQAFTQTQAAWRPDNHLVPVLPWLGATYAALGVVGPLLVALLFAAVVVMALRPGAATWGLEVRAWACSYPLYIMVMAPALTSIFRYLVLAFPMMWMFPDRPSSTAARHLRLVTVIVLAGVGICSQWLWVRHFLVLDGTDGSWFFP